MLAGSVQKELENDMKKHGFIIASAAFILGIVLPIALLLFALRP